MQVATTPPTRSPEICDSEARKPNKQRKYGPKKRPAEWRAIQDMTAIAIRAAPNNCDVYRRSKVMSMPYISYTAPGTSMKPTPKRAAKTAVIMNMVLSFIGCPPTLMTADR